MISGRGVFQQQDQQSSNRFWLKAHGRCGSRKKEVHYSQYAIRGHRWRQLLATAVLDTGSLSRWERTRPRYVAGAPFQFPPSKRITSQSSQINGLSPFRFGRASTGEGVLSTVLYGSGAILSKLLRGATYMSTAGWV